MKSGTFVDGESKKFIQLKYNNRNPLMGIDGNADVMKDTLQNLTNNNHLATDQAPAT